MSIYVKLVCEALTDSKLLAAGPGAFWIWTRGLLYAKQHLTDGVVPADAMPIVAFGLNDVDVQVSKLVTLKLWEPCENGHRVPAKVWAKYQTTAADVEAKREKNRANGKKGADTRWQKNGDSLSENGETLSKNSQSPNPRNSQSTEHKAQSTDSKAQSTNISGETGKPSSPLVEPERPVLEFPCDGNPSTWALVESQLAQWRELYPSLDVDAVCRDALAWVLADSSKRKTARGMPRFLVGWLSRTQDRGRGRLRQQPSQGSIDGI